MAKLTVQELVDENEVDGLRVEDSEYDIEDENEEGV